MFQLLLKVTCFTPLIVNYFWCFTRQSLIVVQTNHFILYYSTSDMFSGLSFFNSIYNSCWYKISITSHASNVSTLNLAFIVIDLVIIKGFDDSSRIVSDAEQPQVESPGIIFIEDVPFMNLQ